MSDFHISFKNLLLVFLFKCNLEGREPIRPCQVIVLMNFVVLSPHWGNVGNPGMKTSMKRGLETSFVSARGKGALMVCRQRAYHCIWGPQSGWKRHRGGFNSTCGTWRQSNITKVLPTSFVSAQGPRGIDRLESENLSPYLKTTV